MNDSLGIGMMIHFSVERLEWLSCGVRTEVRIFPQLNRFAGGLPETDSDSKGFRVGGRVNNKVLRIITRFLNPYLTRYMRKLG